MSLIQTFSQRKETNSLEKFSIKRKIRRDNHTKKCNFSTYSKGDRQRVTIICYIILLFLVSIKTIKNSEITIKIVGTGRQAVLFYGYTNACPDYIYLNDDTENNYLGTTDNCRYIIIPSELESTIINVKLIWTSKIYGYIQMFKEMPHLKEVDLSKFDSSEVDDMTYMFQDSPSITSINFQNYNTRKVRSFHCTFYNCRSLKELDLSSFDTSNVVEMRLMFFGCGSLESLKIENFDTSSVINMEYLFFQCYNLKHFSIKNFDTSKVQKMNYMFFQCNALDSLDLSNFDTSSVIDMESMFGYSEYLTSINVSSFDTSKVQNMKGTFAGCSSLNNLDLSNFDTREVINMDNTFTNCRNLKSLDLSNFVTPKLTTMSEIFAECVSLTSLDISNFITNQVTNMFSLFKNCQNLLELNLLSFETPNVNNMESMFSGCNKLTTLNISSFNANSATTLKDMFLNCEKLDYVNFQLYIDLYDNTRLDGILTNTPQNMVICINNNSQTIKLIDIIFEKICPTIYCGYNWKPKQKIILPDGTCGHMIETTQPIIMTTQMLLESTVLAETTQIYESTEIKESTNIIETTQIKESTNIVETSQIKESTNIVETTQIKESTNIVETTKLKESTNIVETTQIKESTNTIAPTTNMIKSTEMTKESTIVSTTNKEEKEMSTIQETQTYLYKHTSILSTSTINNNNFTLDDINKIIYENITKNYLLNYNGNEIIIEGKDGFFFRATTKGNMFNRLKNDTIKLSKIDLGICEDKLRQKYNLNDDIELIIISMEKETDISSDRDIQFEVYESLNKTRLNLSVCEDTPVDIYIPLVLSEELTELYNELKELGYNLFDINDKFYQDICAPYRSPNGTDVLLADRVRFIFDNEEIKCPSGCKTSDYSIETQDLKCKCDVESSEIKLGSKESTKTLYTSFYNVLKYSNYKVLFCYKLAFRLINFKINKGCIIICIFFGIYLLFLFMYAYKGFKLLKLDVARYVLIESNQQKLELGNIEDNKESKYVNTIEKLKPSIAKSKRKTHHNAKVDYNNIINKSTGDALNRKSLGYKHRKSNKSVVFPPKKSSRKSLVLKQY